MTNYEFFQLEKYGDILPGSDAEPPLENDEMNEPYFLTINPDSNEQRDSEAPTP